jgi:hypothetical protein
MTHLHTIACDGFTLTARIEPCLDHCAPWHEFDGHGPVSDWRWQWRNAHGGLDKAPGERLLWQDARAARYYGFAEAVRIARRDGWRAPGETGEGTPGEIAARAAEADFQRLRAYCAGEWHYVGVVVAVARAGVTLDAHAASLWMIESDADEYLRQVAEDLTGEALEVGRGLLGELCACH